MILNACLAAALFSTPLLQGRTAAPSATNTSTETAEGVEILRRVLIDALDRAFEEKTARDQERFFQSNGLVTTLWAGGHTVQHARAFHMPDMGLFFALDLSLPVVKKEGEEGDDGKPENDEWDRARREVRGALAGDGVRLRALRVDGGSSGEIDPKAIDRATDLVLRTLGRHVARIEGLASNDTVTVALRLSGRDRSWLHEWSEDEPHALERREGDESEREAPEVERTLGFSAYVLATGREVREQNLVLRIRVADLTAADQATPEELRRAARVNRY